MALPKIKETKDIQELVRSINAALIAIEQRMNEIEKKLTQKTS
jgi:hypothetical protein